MAEQQCGASVYACRLRVAKLDTNGVPLPGAGNLYVSDALTKIDVTPVFYTPPEVEVPNGCGDLCVTYKPLPRLKRYELAIELCNFDPELEVMFAGGESFTTGGFTVGMSSPPINTAGAPNGISVEAWSKHIVNGDIDGTWPYIKWAFFRSYWTPDKFSLNQSHQPRTFSGYTSQNPNFYNGPANDWLFASDRSWGAAKTASIPAATCGASTLVGS